jgi:hypothetical protein
MQGNHREWQDKPLPTFSMVIRTHNKGKLKHNLKMVSLTYSTLKP